MRDGDRRPGIIIVSQNRRAVLLSRGRPIPRPPVHLRPDLIVNQLEIVLVIVALAALIAEQVVGVEGPAALPAEPRVEVHGGHGVFLLAGIKKPSESRRQGLLL